MWEFDHKVWALKNWCFWVVVLEKTLKSPWTAWRSKPSILKEINPEYSLEDCCWSSNTLAMWCEEPAYWKRSWCWDRLRAGGEDGDRGWDSGMASLTQWTWIWTNSGRQWRTGRPGMLQSVAPQSVGHNLVTEQQQLNMWIPENTHQIRMGRNSTLVRKGSLKMGFVPIAASRGWCCINWKCHLQHTFHFTPMSFRISQLAEVYIWTGSTPGAVIVKEAFLPDSHYSLLK